MNDICERCKWYYEDLTRFCDSDYVICDECGRLVISPGRSADVFQEAYSIPKILWVGANTTCIRDVRRATYDPRKVVTSCEGMDVLDDYKCGGHSLVSEKGDVAKEFIITKDKLTDRSVYNIISEEMPTIALVVLNCLSDMDDANYVKFIKSYSSLMDIISIYNRPIIVVLSNVDNIVYPEVKVPNEYPEDKVTAINKLVERYHSFFEENGARVDEIIPVSTYMRWGVKGDKKNGVTAEDVEIIVDGRYNIDKLRELIKYSGYRKLK